MTLRPDERAVESEIERDKRLRKNVGGIGKAALEVASIAPALGLSSKIMPFLSEHIPVDLAMKGINYLSPKLGQFLQKGMSEGLDIKEGLNYVKEQITPKQKEQEQNKPPEQKKNIIQQYSPELDQFMMNQIQKGASPLEAATVAKLNLEGKDFKKIIKQMEKDHRTDWSAIVESIYGSAEQPKQGQQMQQQAAPQMGAGQQQIGPGLQKLMQLLQQRKGQ